MMQMWSLLIAGASLFVAIVAIVVSIWNVRRQTALQETVSALAAAQHEQLRRD